MLVTQQPILRKFWYAVMPLEHLDSGPKPFTLLGSRIVIWKGADGRPAALEDRCCHRTAQLSRGSIDAEGRIVCGYHGWTYDCSGKCVSIPQSKKERVPCGIQARSFRCEARYGYVWVALDQPLECVPEFPEDSDAHYRRILQFYEKWDTSPLRFLENAFDNAHFSFVHKETFGVLEKPAPSTYNLAEKKDGFEAETLVSIRNPDAAHRVTGSKDRFTERHLINRWWVPFVRRFGCVYEKSGVHHIIYNCATPIDDKSIMLVQWLYRNDSEVDCSTDELIAWDRPILDEDRGILESTDPDVCIDITKRTENHMVSDKPGIMMRRKLLHLLQENGESEIYKSSWKGASDPIRR